LWKGEEFSGSKIALLCGDHLIAYQRDFTPNIPFQGMWDLPGGGRENGETPVECALRELYEEFTLTLSPDRIIWINSYPGHSNGGLPNYFMVGTVTSQEIDSIVFGNEGERWSTMKIEAFLNHDQAVPHLQYRLNDYFSRADH
jgi:8-oxo-dGTP diphosphatase